MITNVVAVYFARLVVVNAILIKFGTHHWNTAVKFILKLNLLFYFTVRLG